MSIEQTIQEVDDTIGNVTFNAVSQSAVVQINGRATLQIYSIGSWVGSIGFLGSVDGSTYFNVLGYLPNGTIANGFAFNTSFTIQCGGYVSVKIVTSAWTSGTAVVYWDASEALNQNLQPTMRMIDFSGNGISSQSSGAQRALDVGINVAGVQIDPRQTRALTSADVVTVNPTDCNLSVTGTSATGVALTVTLPAVASMSHHITYLDIQVYNTAARTGGATPVIVTSTNLPGANAWTFATAGAVGSTDRKEAYFPNPYRSAVVGTATTIVCPATVGVIWRVNVVYYAG